MNGSTLEVEDCAKPEVFPLVAAEMARMHSSLQNKNKNKTVLNENILSQDKNKKNGTTTTTSGMTTSPLWKKMRQFNKLAEESMQVGWHNFYGKSLYNDFHKFDNIREKYKRLKQKIFLHKNYNKIKRI